MKAVGAVLDRGEGGRAGEVDGGIGGSSRCATSIPLRSMPSVRFHTRLGNLAKCSMRRSRGLRPMKNQANKLREMSKLPSRNLLTWFFAPLSNVREHHYIMT